MQSGKGLWLQDRDEKVVAKGLGEVKTYWLDVKGDRDPSATSGRTSRSGTSESYSTAQNGEWGADYMTDDEDMGDNKDITIIRKRLHARLADNRAHVMSTREAHGSAHSANTEQK